MKPLIEEIDKFNFNQAMDLLMKTRRNIDDVVTYEDIEYKTKHKLYKIKAEHIPIEYVFKYAKSNCKKCTYGKGYYVINILKSKIPNPEDYIMLSSVPLKEMTEEQQRIWLEKEKSNKFWKVMMPCKCALQKAMNKEKDILCNEVGNIILRVSYTYDDIKGDTNE